MLNIGIVTDSLSNLPLELAKKNDIFVIPGLVYVNNRRFISRDEVTTQEIITLLSKGNNTLKTAIPPPGEYFKTYVEILDEYDYIISLHCPTKQTGFMRSAIVGSKRTKDPRKIIHKECGVATLGLGLVALATAISAKETSDLKFLLKKIDDFSKRVDVIGALNSFDYIRRSGRVKLKIAGTFASMLSIKPVLAMHGSQILLLEKTIVNRQKSLDKLFEHFCKRIDDSFEPKMIGISHIMSEKECLDLKNSVCKKFPSHEIITTDVDPMIATNTGPGLMLITYFGHDTN